MIKKHFALWFCTLAVLAFTVSACSALVTIPRNDGTRLPLEQISDIIRHVTGNLSSNDLFLPKNSLMMLQAVRNGGSVQLTPSIYTFYRNGNEYGIFDVKSGSSVKRNMSGLNWNGIPGLHSSALTTTTADGQKSVLATIPASSASHSQYRFASHRTDTSRDVTYNFGFTSTRAAVNQQGLVMDSKSGMTVRGFDGELCAEVYCSNGSDGLVTLRFSSVVRDGSSSIKTTQLGSLTWSRNFKPVKIGSGDVYSCYVPASIAIGDLNGDGYKNEIALITADVDNVCLSVFQVAYSNGTFSRSVLKDNETLFTFVVSADRRTAVRNGLWGGLPSVCAVAADFDVDGTDELAALFTNDEEEFYRGPEETEYPGYYHYVEDRGEYVRNSYYLGITDRNAIYSGLKIAGYKWNGSTLSRGEPQSAYINALDASAADVKAVAADWDGDGRKSLVVMVSELTGDDKYIGYIVTAYDWTNGIFVRNEDVDMIATTGAVDLYRTSDDNVKYSFTYPVFARNCSLIAGPFTGEMGRAFPVDNLVVRYLENYHRDYMLNGELQPVEVIEEGNELVGNAKVELIYNISTKGSKPDFKALRTTRVNNLWNDEIELIAFAAADFASEGAEIGAPTKIVSTAGRNNYLAILQAPPYHVDTLTKDGTALQKEPRNFTYRPNTEVSYSSASSITSKDVVNFNMSKSVETICTFDTAEVRGLASGMKSIVGAASSILNNDILKANITSFDTVGEKFGCVLDFASGLFDKVEETTEKVNEHTAKADIIITTAASLKDVLYMATSKQHIWRYPILTNPAPAWLVDRQVSSGDFGNARITNQDTYITFVVDDTPSMVSMYGHNDAGYQPFRELGNLFSYPSSLEGVQGYANRTQLTKMHTWVGPKFSEKMSFTEVSSDHTVTSTKVDKGMISGLFSMLDSIIGKDNIAREERRINIPDPKDFTRTVSDTEQLEITLPNALEGAGYSMPFEGYLDAGGAMTVAFAVSDFYRDDAIWGTRSLYSRKPDPALVLSQKFIAPNNKNNKFVGNDNDPTALQIGGVRISVPYFGRESNSLLVKNLTYKFEVPVYNASFVTARNVKLRLSYANKNSYKGVKHFNTVARTTIADTTIETLPGWGSGGNRVMAEFTWTPTVKAGNYYLFVEIDPDNTINEVHENRKDSRGNILDFGGNNLGFFKVSVADASSRVYNRNKITSSSAAVSAADADDDLNYLYAHTDLKLNGTEDWSEFQKLLQSGDHTPMVIEAEITYDGEEVIPYVTLIGEKYKESAVNEYVYGDNKNELTDDDVELYFLYETIALIPGESQTLFFIIDDPEMLKYSDFLLELPSNASIDNFEAKYQKSDEQPGGQDNRPAHSSSGGGCDAGYSALGLALMILMLKRKTR